MPESPKSSAPMLCRKLPTVCCWSSGGVEAPLRSAFLFSAVCMAFHTSSTVFPLPQPCASAFSLTVVLSPGQRYRYTNY